MDKDKLKSIYEELYQMNYEGGEEDYLEEYEARFSPENLAPEATADDELSRLRSLVKEIINDTGDPLLIKGWVLDAGGDESLLAALGLS